MFDGIVDATENILVTVRSAKGKAQYTAVTHISRDLVCAVIAIGVIDTYFTSAIEMKPARVP